MDIRDRLNPFSIVLATMLCAWAVVLSSNAAQPASEPQSINQLVGVTSQFNTQQRQQIADYATYWASALLADDLEVARNARRRLVEPFGMLGVRRIFRDEYARAAMPELSRVIESGNTFAAINAIQAATEFQHESALAIMRERCGSREPRWQVRLWASRAIGRIINDAEDIPERTVVAAVRDLSRAGENETNWLVLQRQFEAMASIGADESREAQVTVLRATLARIANDPANPSDQMQAVHRALILMRNQILDPTMPSTQLRTLGTQTAPLLGQVLEIGVMHWEAADADESLRAIYSAAMLMSRNLLELIDAQVRGQAAQRPHFASEWGNGNKAAFEADVNRWRQVLAASPYARR